MKQRRGTRWPLRSHVIATRTTRFCCDYKQPLNLSGLGSEGGLESQEEGCVAYLLGPENLSRSVNLESSVGMAPAAPEKGVGETRWEATAIFGTGGDGGVVVADGV